MTGYDPTRWYWQVGGDATRVWSSAAAAYVPADDATYVAWLADGGFATAIPTEAELQAVLATHYPAGWPPTLAQQAAALVAAGLTISCTGTPAIGGTYDVGPIAQAHIAAVQARLNAGRGFPPGGAATIDWIDAAGVAHTMTPGLFLEFGCAASDFVFAAQMAAAGASTALPSASVTIP